MRFFRWISATLFALFGRPTSATVRGERAAAAASERLLAQVGGRPAWAGASTLYLEERLFLRTGVIAERKSWLDLATGARRQERAWPGGRTAQWLSPAGGFEINGITVSQFAADELAAELQGVAQEPYAVYRRLALRDPALEVRLRDTASLYVYDGDENLLCWFVLDAQGTPTSWGNFRKGSLNQLSYGPLTDFGGVRLPKWGVSAGEVVRAEIIVARLSDETVVPPMR